MQQQVQQVLKVPLVLRVRQDLAGAQGNGTAGSTGIPSGVILLWSGIQVTFRGWVLCDGSNGTPDLRDRFVGGASVTGSQGVSASAVDLLMQP